MMIHINTCSSANIHITPPFKKRLHLNINEFSVLEDYISNWEQYYCEGPQNHN